MQVVCQAGYWRTGFFMSEFAGETVRPEMPRHNGSIRLKIKEKEIVMQPAHEDRKLLRGRNTRQHYGLIEARSRWRL